MNSLNSIEYYPVSPAKDRKAGELTISYFANPVSPVSNKYIKNLSTKIVMCDSVGLQVLKALNAGKIFFFGSMVKSKINNPDILILGIPCQCKEYARLSSLIAMCIDLPSMTDDTDLTYYWKVLQSQKAKKQMIKLAKYLCPDTQLAIVLQPRNPLEIRDYYSLIYAPSVKIYAYPIRDFRNKPKDALGNSYVLSFLHNVGVEHVHFLGSNAPPIIFLLAHAISLGLFKKVSFDSRTWNQVSFSGHRYLHPDTLTITPPKNKAPLHPESDLRVRLSRHPGLFESTLQQYNPPDPVLAKEWLGILNIRMIERFKDMVLSVAKENDLAYFVKHFREHTNKNNGKLNGNSNIENVIRALDLLEESKGYGHEDIEKKYGSKIEEHYC